MFLAIAAALLVGGYLYFWLDDEILRQVQGRLASHYRGLDVRVGSARFEQDRGITIEDIAFVQNGPGGTRLSLLSIEQMFLAGKIRMEELISGQPPVEHIVLRRAQIHVVRQADGQWSTACLLPVPCFSDQRPAISVEDATVVLQDSSGEVPSVVTLPDVDLTLTPVLPANAGGIGTRYQVVGTITGPTAREMRFEGEIGPDDGSMNLAVTVSGFEITHEILSAVRAIAIRLPADVDATGRADFLLRIDRARAGAPLDWSVTARVDRGRFSHPRLPEPLTDVSLAIQADSRRLFIEQLTGKCGPASVALACERAGWGSNAPLGLNVKITGLVLDERIEAALPAWAMRIWQRFQPRGTIDAGVRLSFDGREWRPQLSARCRGISLTDADKFPYVVDQATGTVEYESNGAARPDRLAMNLTGFGAGRPVSITAELTHLMQSERPEPAVGRRASVADAATGAPKHADVSPVIAEHVVAKVAPRHPVGWVVISGSDIPLHEQLMVALPENGERLVRSLQPQGAIDFEFRAEWKELTQRQAHVTQKISLKDCTIKFAPFPYPLYHVHGLLTEDDRHWTLHDIEGRGGNDTSRVKCRGTSTPRDAGSLVDLQFMADHVPLDDNLRQALPLPAQRAWGELQPQGLVNLAAHVVQETGQPKPAISFTVEPCEKTVSITPLKFPYRFEQVEGAATYQDGAVELANLRAVHDRVDYSATNGTWRPTQDGGWNLDLQGISADRLVPQRDRDLLVALPPALQSIMERLQPTGTFSLTGSRLSLTQSRLSNRMAAAWDVNLDCHQAAVQCGIALQSATGGIRLVGKSDAQTTYTLGELALDSVLWKDAQLTNVRGPFFVDRTVCLFGEPASVRQSLAPRRVTADAYGGNLRANVELQHANNPNYRMDLELGGMSLARFANERLGGPRELSGNVTGKLFLAGTGRSAQTLSGNGELQVIDANIYELPVLVSLLKVLKNRTPTTTAFNRCDVKFTVQGEHIQFEHLNLLGDAVSLYGEGGTNLDRELDLVFYTLIGPADLPIPLVRSIIGQVSQQGWQLKVRGRWDDPDVQRLVAPALNDALQRIQAGAATMTTPATAVRDSLGAPR